MMRTLLCLVLAAVHAGAVASPPAELKLHGLFRDNMVLQCDVPAPVWGTAEPGKTVTVTVGGMKKTAVADGSGRCRPLTVRCALPKRKLRPGTRPPGVFMSGGWASLSVAPRRTSRWSYFCSTEFCTLWPSCSALSA